MSILMKRRRSLFRRVILVTALAAISTGWFAIPRPQAQQIDNTQNKQRPRRVGAEQMPPPPPIPSLTKKPDTPAAGDEVGGKDHDIGDVS